MKCPVCEKKMETMVCACGYDASRDYGAYPTFGPVPGDLETVSHLRERQKNLLLCAGCGHHAFGMNRDSGLLGCLRCGRTLNAQELLPLRRAMGWENASAPEQKNPEPLVNVLSQVEKKAKAEAVSRILSQLAQQKYASQAQSDGKRIVSIAAGASHTLALYADGTVGAVGSNKQGQCDVTQWREIVAIAAYGCKSVGVKADGTVVATGVDTGGIYMVKKWADIKAAAIRQWYVLGLKKDGTAVSAGGGKVDVSKWRDLTAIAAGEEHALGLKSDGTVVTAGKSPLSFYSGLGWKKIRAIAAGRECVLGLKEDGTVLAAGKECGGVEQWRDITAISAGEHHVVGLKKDGTALAVGSNYDRRCAVATWRDLVLVTAGDYHTVGLKKNGTLTATGNNDLGQCDVSELLRR